MKYLILIYSNPASREVWGARSLGRETTVNGDRGAGDIAAVRAG